MHNITKNEIIMASKIPLSSEDIEKLLDGKTRIMSYKQLMKHKNINEVLEPFGSVVILLESRDNFGHWLCLIKRGDTIEFFDPYGIKPDNQRAFIPAAYKKQHYPEKYLVKLLLNSRYKIRYSEFKLQDINDSEISTCGRWCCMRIIFKDLDEYQFKKLFTGKSLKPDLLVTYATMLLK